MQIWGNKKINVITHSHYECKKEGRKIIDVLCVQEVVTRFITYCMGHYFMDTQYIKFLLVFITKKFKRNS